MSNIQNSILEKWKDISGLDGVYQISSFGRVKSIKLGRLLKPHDNGNGYQLIWLQVNKTKQRYQIHRLVAFHFFPPPLSFQEIHHKDGNPGNNHLNNIEWVSHAQNMQHVFQNGRKDFEAKHWKKVIDLNSGKIYKSISEAARDIGCTMQCLSQIMRNNSKKRKSKFDRYAFVDKFCSSST